MGMGGVYPVCGNLLQVPGRGNRGRRAQLARQEHQHYAGESYPGPARGTARPGCGLGARGGQEKVLTETISGRAGSGGARGGQAHQGSGHAPPYS